MPKSTRRLQRRRIILVCLIGLFAACCGFGFFWLLTMPDVASLRTANPTSTSLIDSRQMQARAHAKPFKPAWVWVPLAQISPHLQRAVIVAEDASFWSHDGFDWEGIRDAAIRNLGDGAIKRGGSTITQQLAKNLYLTSERSWFRKAREAMITRALERRLTKRRILELYLNVVEWGRDVYGAEAAARRHFGKSAKDLTQEEAALLAAILPSPRRYDPIKRTRFLTSRQQSILHWMSKTILPASAPEPAKSARAR
jgi:monofunctional biosynthetic peptidoglycan transglycosylase